MTKAIILAAGKGTRLGSLTDTTPKPLIEVLNKPILIWTLETLLDNGIQEVIIVIGSDQNGEKIKKYLTNIPLKGLTIHFAVEKELLGTAHAAQAAKNFIEKGESFLVVMGDDVYGGGNIKTILEEDQAVMGKKVNDPKNWGILKTDQDGNLIEIIEKPKQFVGDFASIALYKLDTKLFEVYSQIELSERGEYEITDSLNLLAKERPIKVIEATDFWLPITFPHNIKEAEKYLSKR